MYRHCNTEESASRQRQMENCLLELMQTHAYDQITISNICQHIGLSRKSFYRYFGNKEGCLYALIDHTILDFAASYLPDHADPPQQQMLEHYFAYWKSLHHLLDVLCQNQLVPCLFERTLLCITEEEYEFRKMLGADQNNDAYERLLFTVTGITGLLINWHTSGYRKTPAQMAATVSKLLAPPLSDDNR